MVGAWCFADHFGPAPTGSVAIGPHPHTGIHTVTWLLEGQVVHRDSLGTHQPIRPGQLNLMTAGHGISHAEEAPPEPGTVHGVQLWVAQPEATRHDAGAFEHHAALPEVGVGAARVTVLVGELGGVASPARADTPLVGADLELEPGSALLPLEPAFEHAVVVTGGTVVLGNTEVGPGALAYLGDGRDRLELRTTADARVLLLGGEPFGEEVRMWWNFVGRSRDELEQATREWNDGSERFGTVESVLARIPAPD